jgi:hypothetical protein
VPFWAAIGALWDFIKEDFLFKAIMACSYLPMFAHSAG